MTDVLLIEYPSPMVALLTLNRSQKRNALNIQLIESLDRAILAESANPQRRVIILRGAGSAFCAGLDLQEAADLHIARRSGESLAYLYRNLYRCPLITIAAAHGAALGGGTGLIAACDLAVLADDMRIGYPELQRGLVPALILFLLRRRLAWRDLRELLFLGQMLDANQAVRIGLANRAVPAVSLLESALEMATQVCRNAPAATARSKALMADLDPIDADLAAALKAHLDARDTPESAEGIAAFLEKRPPNWPPRA